MNIQNYLIALLIFIIAGCSGENNLRQHHKKATTKSINIDSNIDQTVVSKKQLKDIKKDKTPEFQLIMAQKIIDSVTPEMVSSVDAKQKFRNFCASCHGIIGNLKINGASDLTKSTLTQKEQVAQVYHGKGLMTPFKNILSESEIVAVTSYISTLRK